MPPYSILMFIFAGALLLYAALLAITKDYNLLPLRAQQSVKPKDPRLYAFQLSKVIALTAAAPAVCGIVGIWSGIGAGVAFVAVLALCLWIGTRMMRNI